jgi:Uma2 family endonuclease
MAIQQKVVTAEEFWQTEFEEGKRYELIKGVIVEMAPSKPENTIIAGRILAYFFNHVEVNDLGYVTGADGGYTLSPGDVQIPDVAFISKARAPKIPDEFHGGPDLAVEVISKTESPRTVNDKTIAYLRAGTRIVLNVYPKEKVIDVCKPSPDGGMTIHTLTIDDILDISAVLPGFKLPVKQIFPE